jgi:hypothetical protein
MSELFPAKSIAVEVVICTDPTREFEFNYWHDTVRIPYLRKTAGIVDVYRYRDVRPDYGGGFKGLVDIAGEYARYLTLYRINDDNPWGLMQQIKQDEQKGGRFLDCAQILDLTVWDFVACRQSISPPLGSPTRLPDGMPESILLFYSHMDPAKKMEHDDWWLYTHAHDVLETPGLEQCSRYLTLNPEPAVLDARILNVYEIDADDPGAVVQCVLEGDRNIRRPQGRFSTFTLPDTPLSIGSGVYRHWDRMTK